MTVVGNQTEAADQICEDREAVYGSPITMQQQVAAHWTALLRSYHQDDDFPAIPPHLVGLMLATMKLHRAAAPFPKKDNDSYVDPHNYIDFAEQADPMLPGKIPTQEEFADFRDYFDGEAGAAGLWNIQLGVTLKEPVTNEDLREAKADDDEHKHGKVHRPAASAPAPPDQFRCGFHNSEKQRCLLRLNHEDDCTFE